MRNFICISARRMWCFSAFFLLLGFFAQGASAEEYYWFIAGKPSVHYSSAPSACQSYQSSGTNASLGEKISDGQYYCRLVRVSDGMVDDRTVIASRGGDACSPDLIYNPDTTKCEKPPSACEQKAGQTTSWTLLRPDLNGLGPIEHACMDNCRIALGTSSCIPAYEGATSGVCTGLGQYTGSDCQPSDSPTGGTPPTDPNPPKEPEEPEEPPPTCGPGFSWSGTTCVKDPPKVCDPSTGEVCPPKDPEDPENPDNPGGDGDGDGDGGDGDGDGEGDGDGDGDGSGTCDPKTDPKKCETTPPPTACDPAKDPNKCGQSSVGGEACDATVTCTGDAIQCAVLRQQKKQTCADETFRKVDEKAVNDLRNAVAASQTDESFQPMKATAENTFDLSNMIDTSSRFSKSCPTVPDWSVPWLNGQNITVKLSFISDFCQYLIWMGYLIVAFGMRRAAEIIAGGMN